VRPASLLFLLACLAGVALALLGDEPLVGLALAAVLLYPLGIYLSAPGEGGNGEPEGRPIPLGGALLAALAGALLVAFLIRLAIAAPDWVDPLSADCGGPSTGAQQLATWFATFAFVLAAVPEAVTLAGLGGRLGGSRALSQLPVTLGLYPAAVALAGIALIVASWATSC
jgi:hypothetical protein